MDKDLGEGGESEGGENLHVQRFELVSQLDVALSQPADGDQVERTFGRDNETGVASCKALKRVLHALIE